MQETRLSSEKIYKFMQKEGLKQKEMAQLMGITANTLRNYFVQDFPKLAPSQLKKIRLAIGVQKYIQLVEEVDLNSSGDK